MQFKKYIESKSYSVRLLISYLIALSMLILEFICSNGPNHTKKVCVKLSNKKKHLSTRSNMLEAHVLAILILGVSSFIVGSIPLKLSRWTQYNLLLSLLLCLGAGVLLATSVVHMLGEVRSKLSEFSELIFCGGFLLLYAVDELIHICIQDVHTSHYKENESLQEIYSRQCSTSSSDGLMSSAQFHKRKTSYGTMEKPARKAKFDSVSQSFIDNCASLDDLIVDDGSMNKNFREDIKCCKKHAREVSFRRAAWKDQEAYSRVQDSDLSSDSSETLSEENLGHCHMEAQPPCPQSSSSLLGLLIALLVHSILEGCSIGVQTKSSEILLVLAAVACHKLVLAFCLGLELAAAKYDGFKFMMALTAFSVGCPIGIGIGVSLVESSDGIFFLEAPLQAVAAGSLLYVAVFEILPRERYKWQHKKDKRFASFLQMIFVLLGFTFIVLLSIFLDSHHIKSITPN